MYSKLFVLLIAFILCQLSQQYSSKLSNELDEENLIFETPETIPRNFGPRFRRDAESTLPSDKAVVVDAQLNSTPIPTTTSSGEELPEGSGQELLSHNELALPKEQAKRSSNEVEGSGQNLPPDASGEEVNKNAIGAL